MARKRAACILCGLQQEAVPFPERAMHLQIVRAKLCLDRRQLRWGRARQWGRSRAGSGWHKRLQGGCQCTLTCQAGEHAAPAHSLLQRALQGGRRRLPQLEPRRQQPHQLRLGVGLLLLVGAAWPPHSCRPCCAGGARLRRPRAGRGACLQAAVLAGVGQQQAVPLLQLQGGALQQPLIVLCIRVGLSSTAALARAPGFFRLRS